MQQEYNWNTFTLKIDINASKETIFWMLSTQAGLESWFLRSAKNFRSDKPLDKLTTVQPNDNYEWMWHGYPDEVLEKGTFLEVIKYQSIAFTFTGGNENGMAVRIKIEPYKDKNIVTLTQHSIPEDDKHKALYHLGCSNGWTFYLANMKSVAEFKNDLRNKDLSLTKMVNS